MTTAKNSRRGGSGRGEGSASDEPHGPKSRSEAEASEDHQQGSASDEPHGPKSRSEAEASEDHQQGQSAGGEGSASDEPHGPKSRSEAEASEDHQQEDHQHWFEPIADHLGSAYLRYSFTKGTLQEITFVVEALGLQVGDRVLDVGCGPGRHAHELARRGFLVHGIDISQKFTDLATQDAPPGATFERLDARRLPFEAEFDAAICLCEGAFGLMTVEGENQAVLAGIAAALEPGGRLALSAFSGYYAVKYHEAATFDASTGVSHEQTEVRDENGRAVEVDLWTTCFTPRELRLMFACADLDVTDLWSVEPGAYARTAPTIETPEFLVIARRV